MEYSNNELFLALMVRLGGIHSASGVSMGRSFRSALREAIIELAEIGDPNIPEMDNLSVWDLIEEAFKRARRIPIQPVLFDQDGAIGLGAIPDWWLIAELLHSLYEWYREDAKWEDSLTTERQIVIAACLLWSLPYEHPRFEAMDLYKEAGCRCDRYLMGRGITQLEGE